MSYGDPDHCRLVLRRTDGTTDSRAWIRDEWPPKIGQLLDEACGSYRVAAIRREGDTIVVVALPAGKAVRRI